MSDPVTSVLQEDTEPPRRGRGTTRSLGRALWMAVALVAGTLAVTAGGTVLVVGGMGAMRPVPLPSFARTTSRLLAASSFRDLALPRDGGSGPADVGAMLEDLGTRSALPEACDGAPAGSPVAARRLLPCLDHTAVFPAAARGFTDPERRHLQGFLQHPGLPVLRALARAPGYERRVAPGREEVDGTAVPLLPWETPLPRLTRLREAAYIEIAR
ncbi:MAG TPA: hypothetical protein VE173_04120, partial [Longimicrobiales bacterium]|nr:hypothetical protein [Longimicrobiales bacterium]